MASYTIGSSDYSTWYYWTSTDASTTASTTTPTSDTWYQWTTDTTSTASGNIVWNSWNKVEYKPQEARPYISPIVTSPKLSSEVKRARAAQRRINDVWRDIKIQEEKERKQLAELTAQALLEDLISDEELAYYKEHKMLVVKGREFDYVINKGAGVHKVEKDKVISLCIHLKEQYKYPETDNVIGLMLMLKANEREFLKTANSHGEVKQSVRDRVLELVERAA